MIVRRARAQRHSTAAAGALKLLALGVTLGSLAPRVGAQDAPPDGDLALRARLTQYLQAGQVGHAIRDVQTALRENPGHAGVRREYVTFHLSLARLWLEQTRPADALTALEAVLAVDPSDAAALALQRGILAARERAGQSPGEIDRLLRIELSEAALDRIKEVKTLRPDGAESLAASERAAWLGAADDHYLARNFNEAFALYEHLLALAPDSPPDVHSRWALSLALALADAGPGKAADPNAPGRLLARAIDVLRKTDEPLLGQIIAGLLTEQGGQLVEAGRSYAEALGTTWQLPPADRRRSAIALLRGQAIERARQLYEATPTRRREGSWQIVLPDPWKQRRTEHFDVFARNDLVAERVAEALEFHFVGIAAWLGITLREPWEPRCEVRVVGTLTSMQADSGTAGVTRAVSHSRVQGGQVLTRKIQVFQTDPWLLASTLPHELTHILLADAYRDAKLPLALDEGLALQTEPAARRLQFRLLLDPVPPDPDALLSAGDTTPDVLTFYARADALTALLLSRAAEPAGGPSARTRVLTAFRDGAGPGWWSAFAWTSDAEMAAEWKMWHADRRRPPRLPLMILTEPLPEHRKGAPARINP